MLFGLVCYSAVVGNFGDVPVYLFRPNFSALTGESILLLWGRHFLA